MCTGTFKLQHKGRNGAVKSVQLCWTGQYKKCVQYDCKCTSDLQYRVFLTNLACKLEFRTLGKVFSCYKLNYHHGYRSPLRLLCTNHQVVKLYIPPQSFRKEDIFGLHFTLCFVNPDKFVVYNVNIKKSDSIIYVFFV